jgi:hypothetical protein
LSRPWSDAYDPMRITWPRLHDTILNGSHRDVEALLAPLPQADLASFAANLKILLDDTMAWKRSGIMDPTADPDGRLTRISIAAVLCEQTPAEVVWWIRQVDLAIAFWSQTRRYGRNADGVLGGALVARRKPAWLADLAGRLAAELSVTQRDPVLYALINKLAEASGAQIPLTDAYVLAWLRESPDPRAHPRLRELAPRLFEIAGTGAFLDWGRNAETLAEFVAEGVIDRGKALDGCSARLLSGDPPGNLRGLRRLHDALAPTPDEVSERLPAYLGMAASSAGATARLAQAALRLLDAHKPLDAATLAELTTAVFARPEANLATAQLAWIGTVIKRDPAAASELFSTLTTAFGHPAVAVQQRALRLAAKYLESPKAVVDDAVRRRLAEAAANALDPALAAEARAVFGSGSGVASAPGAPAPPAYQPTPKPVPIHSVEELAEAFAPALVQREVDTAQAERILEAVARFAHRDRAVFAAFAPIAARYRAVEDDHVKWVRRQVFGALDLLFHAAFDGTPLPGDVARELESARPGTDKAVLLRIYELADALIAGRPTPCVLATPTESNGAIDPQAFLGRLAEYQACGARPMRCDLEQALLRLPPDPGPAVRAALVDTALAGSRLLPGGLPDFAELYARDEEGRIAYDAYLRPMRLAIQRAAHVTGGADLEADMSTYYALIPRRVPGDRYSGDVNGAVKPGDWPTLLPFHPDVVAALAITILFEDALDIARAATVFPRLAETGGAPGPVTHAALAIGMSGRTAENRIAAVDALLILAARGLLDPALLGVHIGQLLRHGLIKHNRIVTGLNDAAQGGAQREVVATVAAAFTELADIPHIRGLPDLLLLAARYAGEARSGPPIEFPRLAELAALTKPPRVVREAKRLSLVLQS